MNSSKEAAPTGPDIEFQEVELELEGHGPVKIKVFKSPLPSIIASARSGSARDVSDALRHLATKLVQGPVLDREESRFLAESLNQVAEKVQKYGKPFGYKPHRRGRPPELTRWQRMRLGRFVDKLHRPSLYGLDFPSQRLTDSAKGPPGVYASLAEQLHVSEMTVRRAHEWWIRRFPRHPE